MACKVYLSKTAINNLDSVSKECRSLLLGWLNKNVEDNYNPRQFGYCVDKYNPNYWKYRIGNFRILSYINKENVIVLGIINDEY